MREWRDILAEHQRVTHAMAEAGPILDAIADAVVAGLRAGGKVLLIGNGGSAADAQHIAAELVGRFRHDRRALPAIALTTDTSTLTAVANDYDFNHVFARQIEALLQPTDVLWCLSTSGSSANVLVAAKLARQRGATVIGFTGQSGGGLAEHCTHVLRAPHAHADRIQEAHILAYHYICERVEAEFAGDA